MSNKQKIWLSSPHMGGEELNYIHHAFEKNWIAPLGDNVNGFEEDLKNYVGTKVAGVFTSGTASIHLALILLGIEAGDEVLCQSFTFSATANPIAYQGATPVFIDSEIETWNMDPELLEQAILDRKDKLPKAIIVVHLYGMPANMKKIREIGDKYGIPIIEDAAEALGSHINQQKCGSFGKLNILSFNGNKIITTSGGGALLSDDEELIKKARFLATQARDDAPHYQHSEIGYNYRMSNISAGIGRGQMEVLEKRVHQRRAVHKYYFEALGSTWFQVKSQKSKVERDLRPLTLDFERSSPTGIYFLKEPEGYFSNRWLTIIIINPEETGGVTREDIRLGLAKHNIEARPLWKPMHLQPVFENQPYYGNGVSEWLFENGLCLPSGSNLKKRDLERVANEVKITLNR
jgi:dTDP-4-amino-4,6-dideoxygalactose transaminase